MAETSTPTKILCLLVLRNVLTNSFVIIGVAIIFEAFKESLVGHGIECLGEILFRTPSLWLLSNDLATSSEEVIPNILLNTIFLLTSNEVVCHVCHLQQSVETPKLVNWDCLVIYVNCTYTMHISFSCL